MQNRIAYERLQSLHSGDWLIKILNGYFSNDLRDRQESYSSWSQKYEIETEGDVEDIINIIGQDLNTLLDGKKRMGNLQELGYVNELMTAAQHVCRPEDLHDIPLMAEYRLNFPAIYRTMEVWAWG